MTQKFLSKFVCFILFSLVITSAGWAQVQPQEVTAPVPMAAISELENRLNLANTLPDYLVTPGDTYVLHMLGAGAVAGGLNRLELFVEQDYTINMAFLGQVSGRGKTFATLKREILGIVRRAYPQSSPSLILTGLGNFQVNLQGTVTTSGVRMVDGLTRLSSIVSPQLLDHSSIRDIRITGPDGRAITADLFLYQRTGNIQHNPYLRPGDVITLSRTQRRVTINGAVYRPGTYQLLPGEGLQDLLTFYADGLRDDADLDLAFLTRNNQGMERQQVNLAQIDLSTITLANLDVLTIPSTFDRRNIIYVEGALNQDRITADDSETAVAGLQPWLRTRLDFVPGATLQQVLRQIYPLLAQQASLSTTYLTRANGEVVPLSFLEALSGNFGKDVFIETYDRIVVPYQQFWVNVTGAVNFPQILPFVEGQTAQYYLNLAGGINNQRGTGVFQILDSEGNRRPANSVVMPMDTIHVRPNNINATLAPTLGTVSAVVGIVTGIVTIFTLFAR